MSSNYFEDFDCSHSIKDFEFTRRAVFNMNKTLDSEEFTSMEAEEIFRFLEKEMNIVVFCDFLKRYVYELAELEEPFDEVPTEVYVDIIRSAFKENRAPFSFKKTSANISSVAKRWLKQESTVRNTVFLLGFGLHMTDEDVEEFLQKVIMEDTFDFQNERECVFWYCYHKGFRYQKAKDLLDQYDHLPVEGSFKPSLWEQMSLSPRMYMTSDDRLLMYLGQLKQFKGKYHSENVAKKEFLRLYSHVCQLINKISYEGKKKEITPVDVEKVLCSGIPYAKNGNLEKVSAAVLCEQFVVHRMTRARISFLLHDEREVTRFDLITLLFYIYAEEVEPDWPTERYMQFIDEANEILSRCGMQDLYPVNPYEAFVLMCLLTDYPMDTYSEVWEKTYDTEI